MSTIEKINSNLINISQEISDVLEQYKKRICSLCKNNKKIQCNRCNYINEANKLIIKYKFTIMPLILKYNNKKKQDELNIIYNNYIAIINKYRFNILLPQYLSRLKEDKEWNNPFFKVPFTYEALEQKYIPKNIIYCSSCGNINKLSVCVKCGAEDSNYEYYFVQQVYEQNNRVIKKKYDPREQFSKWINRILGKEHEIVHEIVPDSVINDLTISLMHHGYIYNYEVTYVELRRHLTYIGHSDYSKNIVQIGERVADIPPPELTNETIDNLHYYFNKVVDVWEKIKTKKQTNLIYHTYFLYKLFEIILPKEELQLVLTCIKLPTENTLINNDKIWQKIVKEINDPSLIYKATNRYQF